MTEYKKCLTTVEEVVAATAKLNDHAAVDANIPAAQVLLEKYDEDVVPNLRIRVGKLLAKARERDPDKQIYNEATCIKIEELAATTSCACDAFDASVQYAHSAVHQYLRAQAVAKALASTLAHSTAELSRAEADARTLSRYEYGAWVRVVAAQMNLEYEDALARKKAREAREWEAELGRRQREQEAFAAAVKRGEDACNPALSIGAVAVRQFVADCTEGAIDPRALGKRLFSLLEAVMRDPSDKSVSKLRVYNTTFAEHFGSPCAEPDAPDDPLAAECAGMARSSYRVVEGTLCLIGYRPQYELAGGFAKVPPAKTGWIFGVAPWERYSERFLTLKEPDPAVDTDEWMTWHERLGDIHSHFAKFVNGRL